MAPKKLAHELRHFLGTRKLALGGLADVLIVKWRKDARLTFVPYVTSIQDIQVWAPSKSIYNATEPYKGLKAL